MGKELEKSFFSCLPNELLVKILSFIDTSNVLNFCETYNCDYFLQERNVVRTIDIAKNYDLYNLETLSKNVNFNHVTTLNVNCLYWIEAQELRGLISRLVNLETLYAIHTQFGLSHEDTKVLSKTKIKKLGVNVRDMISVHTILLSVQTLFIGDFTKSSVKHFEPIVRFVFPNLNKFWVATSAFNITSTVWLTRMSNFFLQCKTLSTLNLEPSGSTKYYSNRRENQLFLMCSENLGLGHSRPSNLQYKESSNGWRLLKQLSYPKPYGPKDAKKLILNEATLNNIFFEELNFSDVCLHTDKVREAIKEILNSSSAQKLKKLCLPLCLLRTANHVKTCQYPKKMKMKIENSSQNVEKMLANFSNLLHLEICYPCPVWSCAVYEFSLISTLTNLQSLIIKVPYSAEVKSLSEVFEKCRLKVLKITGWGGNKMLNDIICENISKATSLVDFRYENFSIPIDKLLENLGLIKTRKLQRIAIFSGGNGPVSTIPYEQFLEINTQLVLLYISIRGLNLQGSLLLQLKDILYFYEEKHPSKNFFLVSEKFSTKVPEAHYEFVKPVTAVASLSPVDDFLTF